jgi:hypothetical protein
MIDLKVLLLKAVLIVAPPGNTKFSMVDSHKETIEEGAVRYQGIVDAEINAAESELCIDSLGGKIESCIPNTKKAAWTVRDLVTRASGLAIAESGLREDVEVGRPSGRGHAGEACLMQILPIMVRKFAPDGDGSPSSLLGSDQEHLVRCFRTGMRMIMQARAHCDWEWSMVKINKSQAQHDSYFGMFSMYGSGNSCYSNNAGKTSYRVAIANKIASVMRGIK